MAKKTSSRSKAAAERAPNPKGAGGKTLLEEALQWLESRGTRAQVKELERYGITATNPFGVRVGDLKQYAKQLGPDHELAQELWKTGRYEARMLATMVADPVRVSAAQMNGWTAEFDNWAIVDAACFHLFDRTKHAWKKVAQWSKAKPEFTKRTAFALLWSLSVHDKDAPNRSFLDGLKLIEAAANDERNFVKKAVNMALRATGKRNAALNLAAIKTAERLAKSEDAAARWVGGHALRELRSPAVRKRLDSRSR
ncbi:MAG: DNA alkylation repair protein [Planctomycetota bacterium]|nr:DNA alkylation repair protein [Planctomycetota bacterium]